MMLIEQPKVSEIKERIVAIVQFGPPTDSDGLAPGKFFQVTIDPELFSPCQSFIRFGRYQGDEIVGWQRADCIYMVAQIGVWRASDAEPVFHLGKSPALEVLQ
jgi:hypothetical protein